MSELYELEAKKSQKKQLWYYLVPVFGVIPALWTLYRGKGNKDRTQVSRLSVLLLTMWIVPYLSLFIGADNSSEIVAFRLLYTNALLTTTYFLVCFGLLFRLQQGKSPYLPLLSSLSNKIKKK